MRRKANWPDPRGHESTYRNALAEDGCVVVENAVGPQRLASIEGYLDRVGMNSAGTRQLLEQEWCRDLVRAIRGHPVLSPSLLVDAVAVQCTLFEKSEERNWLVPLHQDVHVPVRRRVEHPALSGWSEKEGVDFVCPPVEVLGAFVAIRVHIDDCGPEHGPLRVVPGSHADGELDERAAQAWRERVGERMCAVERGGALVMKLLLLHASSKATRPNRRRVLHFVFGTPRSAPSAPATRSRRGAPGGTSALRKRPPTAVELVYDNYQFLAVGFTATERAFDCLVSLAISPKGAALSFCYGSSLPDPDGILLGSGNQIRYVRLESGATLTLPAVEALIRAAVAKAKTPLPTFGRGHTVIKSVSAKQRPRRPTQNPPNNTLRRPRPRAARR